MADLGIDDFDATTVPADERKAYTVMAAGEYLAQIIDSDVQPTKDGQGKQLILTWQILDGEHKDREIRYDRTTLASAKSETAQSIGRRKLADIVLAAGVDPRNRDTTALHYKPMVAKVFIEKDTTGKYGDRNAVRSARSVKEGAILPPTNKPTEPASGAGAGAAAPASTTGGEKPW